MCFTKLQLPGFVLADLYKDVLVDLESEKQVKKTVITTPSQQWFLGENRKKVAIVVRDEDAVYLRDEWLNFLSTILGACKLNLGDVAIINFLKTNFTFEELSEKIGPQYLLLFDVTTRELDLPFIIPHFQVLNHNNCSYLESPSLQSMLGNSTEAKIEKSKLWMSLKQMFNI